MGIEPLSYATMSKSYLLHQLNNALNGIIHKEVCASATLLFLYVLYHVKQ